MSLSGLLTDLAGLGLILAILADNRLLRRVLEIERDLNLALKVETDAHIASAAEERRLAAAMERLTLARTKHSDARVKRYPPGG